MFKYADTHIVDTLEGPEDYYALVYSEDCEEQRGTGYALCHYPGETAVQPYSQDYEVSISFNTLQEALADLDCFPVEDREDLVEWLTEQLG